MYVLENTTSICLVVKIQVNLPAPQSSPIELNLLRSNDGEKRKTLFSSRYRAGIEDLCPCIRALQLGCMLYFFSRHRLLPCVVLQKLLESHGRVAVNLHPSVEHMFTHLQERPVVHVAVVVDVPVNHPGLPLAAPAQHRVVAHHQMPSAYGDVKVIRDLDEMPVHQVTLHPGRVVVADDKVLSPLEPAKDVAHSVVRCAEEEVPEEIDGVIASDSAVPVGHERLVHFLDRSKRTIAEADDVGMAEMRVSREEYHSFANLLWVIMMRFA